jgi:hypothetical protein
MDKNFDVSKNNESMLSAGSTLSDFLKNNDFKPMPMPTPIEDYGVKIEDLNFDSFCFTKQQLIEAFKIYNKEFIDNPESFDQIDNSDDTAILQADKLLSILENIA